jgi:hypothetical protein
VSDAEHFVVDGSNLATEGRTEPSYTQLREAVAALRTEHPDALITVVVDASFEHRIDPSERDEFARAEARGEVISPPAGAVGRGDGFLLQIANRTGATVVSNDSFQEFHATYEWLFEPGRLVGGKPVPGVGWIFSLRRPVRGVVSRRTTQKAKRERQAQEQVAAAIAEATADAIEGGGRRRRRRAAATPPQALNEPAAFLQFVIDHRLGTEVTGTVDAFSSHGAFVDVEGVRCYVPLSAMGDPPPRRARDVLRKGEQRTFVVQAVDAPRRGIELGLPGFASVAGTPTSETVEAEVRTSRRAATKKAPAKAAPAKKAPAKTAPAKKAPAKTAPAKKAPAKAAAKAAPAKGAPATKPAAKQTPAKATPATKPPAKKTPTKKTPAKKTPAKATPAKQADAAPRPERRRGAGR